jgi:hypothetical protein
MKAKHFPCVVWNGMEGTTITSSNLNASTSSNQRNQEVTEVTEETGGD